MSYAMLRRDYKTCFLYAGVFPRSYVISVSELIRLWAMEGFTGGRSYRVDAEVMLDELVSASVVLVHKESSTFLNFKACRVHYVFWNLCISIAEKEKFCHVLNKYTYSFPLGTNHHPRMCSHNNVILGIEEVRATMESILSIRSLLCLGPYNPYPMRINLCFTLLKVLNAVTIRFYTFPDQILNLVRLKYLAITYGGVLPKSIKTSKTSSFDRGSTCRYKILGGCFLSTYRNLEFEAAMAPPVLRIRPTGSLYRSNFSTNLETLSDVSARSCTRGILARMTNLRKLGIRIVLGQEEKENFGFFSDIADMKPDLDSFKCIVSGFNTRVIPELPKFPCKIRKITLSGCRFPWKRMTVLCNLSSLRVLKLRCNAFRGPVWEFAQGGLLFLEYLLLEDLDMEVWGADTLHLPKLQSLAIRHCYKLREIPIGFGDIYILYIVELEDCCPSVATSAKKIQEPHRKNFFPFSHLQIHIHSSWEDKKKA
ncbi:putative late blight resistance protein homolog R1A-10 [Andrographis paniculata]|uniref:putative late blight resistance protein homolog R1A-10 n=1 Tax=Andrographis paniculata TaxID=175694 RepID=UPI0021E7F8C4|nr:putative late blight resistance protein homolog R1A-10 [Andrographis paniculata]XP_051115929.1 putative late blight resistance protein homolog R1A-10 [Andrographis paniculata]